MSDPVKFSNCAIHDQSVKDAVMRVLESGQFILGPDVERFEAKWAAECGAKYCVGTSSGTSALTIALKHIAGAQAGKFVVVPMLSYAATVFAVVHAGFTPIFCPVDECGLMDQLACTAILDEMLEDIAAVVPVHLYGQYMEILPIILKTAIVIEDACQAHGVVNYIQGKAACFSFYPAKNLGAVGDAGAIVCDIPYFYQTMRQYVNQGDSPGEKYAHHIVGDNLRLDAIQAAVLNTKLEISAMLAQETINRREVAREYATAGIFSYATLKPSSNHLYPILVDKPDLFRQRMSAEGIETGRHYPYMLQDVAKDVGDERRKWRVWGSNFNAKRIAEHVVTLPIGSHVLPLDVKRVVEVMYSIADRTSDSRMWKVREVENAD